MHVNWKGALREIAFKSALSELELGVTKVKEEVYNYH